MGQTFSLGRISGIRIGVNWSVLLIVALVVSPSRSRRATYRTAASSAARRGPRGSRRNCFIPDSLLIASRPRQLGSFHQRFRQPVAL